MKSDELRDQAKRWRSRAPGQEPEIADALVEAAGSFEALADEKDKKDGKPAPAPQPAEFIHRAYDPKKPA
jgi:hypothetical protein